MRPSNSPRRSIVFCSVCAILMILLGRAEAATLANYERRVANAADLVDQLAGAFEDETRTEPLKIRTRLDTVRQMLPEKETIESGGERIAINNDWLHELLAQSENATTQTARAEILAHAAARLRALHDELKQTEQAQSMTAGKDANKQRLAAILRRPEYVRTAAETSALDRLIDRFLRWLSKLVPKPKPMRAGGSNIISAIAQIFVVSIAVGAIALLLWRYGPRLMQLRRKKKKTREARIVLGERLDADQTSADLLAQAEALARSGDLRAAIRKAYIALLCELADRKLISLAQHKTNRDYVNSVRDKGTLYSAMRNLTQSFELHWYGFVPAGEADWNEFRNGYRRIVDK